MNSIALNEYIADTVGAMVGSNTETGIAVTFEDGDNTLDFVIGTLNQDTTGLAGTATALATARTIGGTSFDGSGNVTAAATIQANSVDGTMIALGSDAAGDVMYYNGTNYVRLTKGSDDEILTLASGIPSWAASSGGMSNFILEDDDGTEVTVGNAK